MNKYFNFTRPINIKTNEVTNKISAVERLAGIIRPQTTTTGKTNVTTKPLKSSTLSCRKDKALARYIINASLAKSDV